MGTLSGLESNLCSKQLAAGLLKEQAHPSFEFNGRKMTLHRPHPNKEALRYRVLAVRDFIERMEIKP
jgi:hypothetical protein